MSLLVGALLVPVALALLSTPTIAKEINGAPKILLGTFSEVCGAYYRRDPHFAVALSEAKGKYYYANCNIKACVFQVLNYRADPGAYLLRLRREGYQSTEQVAVERINDNEFVFTERGSAPRKLMRCTDADVASGIGLQSLDETNDPEFAFYYVLSVPSRCPGLTIDQDAVNKKLGSRNPAKERNARMDAGYDEAMIKDYCRDVLKAFGPNGRVIPDLLRPAASGR
jgi:hypothetical protein